MSRATKAAKDHRRRRRKLAAHRAEERRLHPIRGVGGCAICGSLEVEWVCEDWRDVPDPVYRAICKPHAAYAVATIFGQAV